MGIPQTPAGTCLRILFPLASSAPPLSKGDSREFEVGYPQTPGPPQADCTCPVIPAQLVLVKTGSGNPGKKPTEGWYARLSSIPKPPAGTSPFLDGPHEAQHPGVPPRPKIQAVMSQPIDQRLSFTLFATASFIPSTDSNSSTVARLIPATEPNLLIRARFLLVPTPGIPSREEAKVRWRCTCR